MKKVVSLLLSLSMIFTMSACQSNTNQSEKITSDTAVTETTNLTNHMTATERENVVVRELSLIDTEAEENTENLVQLEVWTNEDYLNWYEENKEDVLKDFSEEEYNKLIDDINSQEFKNIVGVLVNDEYYTGFMPPNEDYNGGELYYSIYVTETHEDGSQEQKQDAVELESFDEFKTWYKEYLKNEVENGALTQNEADKTYEQMLIVFESVMNDNYEILEEPIENYILQTDYKSNWEFDKQEVMEIAESVKEISIYDEELDTEFIVHVTLPPNFDKSESYPAFVMTDGVWRFGNHAGLRKLMENGQAEDVILVSIGYDFSLDGTDNSVRGKYFCENKDLFLDFITDNLMPYLSESYTIDFSRSALYGHSLGGVFTHFSAFNSDLYENQPFEYYIIGSPAFWSPYFLPTEKDPNAFKSEYGYFERQQSFDKTLYVCGGENEDADYAEYYGENDTTLEGIDNIMSRFEEYGITTAKCEIYENSNHYEYIPLMFEKFFLKYYKL